MAGWTCLRELVRQEIIQRSEEGCDTAGLEERWRDAATDDELMAIYSDLRELQIRPDYPYQEPSHLESIIAGRKPSCWDIDLGDELLDRVHGAWLGRIAGCLLGKPVENWSRDVIERYLRSIGEYPLRNYIPLVDGMVPNGVELGPLKLAARGFWNSALVDDDTNYTVLSLKIIENHGRDFTTGDVGKVWLESLPYMHACTAERQAYLNLANDVPLEDVPLYLNPYREWIGAQIRADFWGYCAPGFPQKAAELAFRDAALTHRRNGIYGAMFCAAAISAAFGTDDLDTIIAAGLDVIPPKSRLAETVHDCLYWRSQCSSWQDAHGKMMQTYYGQYNSVHTNNNLAIVLIALLFGWPDFENIITTAVMQGMDTDCNGATAGSIIGAVVGAVDMPRKWVDPLGDTLETSVSGFFRCSISELATRTVAQARKVLEPYRQRRNVEAAASARV